MSLVPLNSSTKMKNGFNIYFQVPDHAKLLARGSWWSAYIWKSEARTKTNGEPAQGKNMKTIKPANKNNYFNAVHKSVSIKSSFRSLWIWIIINSLFHSCVLSPLAFEWKGGWSWFCFDTNPYVVHMWIMFNKKLYDLHMKSRKFVSKQSQL